MRAIARGLASLPARASVAGPATAAAPMAAMATPRHDWTREEIQKVYEQPLLELVFAAASVHRAYWHPGEVQKSTLMSIKTGGCTENCGYCSQSQHNDTFVKPTPMAKTEEILAAARRAKAAGSTRFCMGSAWREVGNKHAFKRVLEVVKEIDGMGMEVCTTLGMLTKEQAMQLKEAGLTAYNHNLDTSPEYYPKVVTTRTYEERLETIANVRAAGISVCCGGIIGMGEEDSDRIGLLQVLATMSEHPESVPINALVPVAGTPLGDALIKAGKQTTWDEMVRMIATARIVLPRTAVRLSAGRKEYPVAAQALMFLAGANSVFTGDQLLTTANPAFDEDSAMFALLGLEGKPPHKPARTTPYVPEDLIQVNRPDPILTVHSSSAASSSDDASLRKAQRLLRLKNGPGMDEFVEQSRSSSGCA